MNNRPPYAAAQGPYQEGDIGDERSRPPVIQYDPPPPQAQAPPFQQITPPSTPISRKWQSGRVWAQGLVPKKKISKKWQRRLYWIVPLCIVALVFAVLFEIYKKDFERWLKPVSEWLKERESWSWTIPTAILVILSFPPLFGHEVVQLIIGLAYPLGVALGIACAGAVLGEAACFIVFKYFCTGWVENKIAKKVNWAATARVTQEAGFRGVLVIRYSIVPPHLANPLFSCTGMKFWLYMITVVLSLPKSLVFVALGSPSSKDSQTAKWGKVAAIAVVVIITIFASLWIRKKMIVATRTIMAERGISADGSDEELGMLNDGVPRPSTAVSGSDTSYKSEVQEAYPPYQGQATEIYQPYRAHEIGIATSMPSPYSQQGHAQQSLHTTPVTGYA
ncbi:uncharacterized protein RAG0_02220 [Rhynchosporium agropyri]|uniref:Golgi apparatus membrane protein TVP38 n=1 Tax=Rhynchosporium agropyri TaxID=914238 RepID=A0A1E1K548_9HELO|nr:uncharacterized protein RAG0_02220 [Rhynchosporium agropyri]